MAHAERCYLRCVCISKTPESLRAAVIKLECSLQLVDRLQNTFDSTVVTHCQSRQLKLGYWWRLLASLIMSLASSPCLKCASSSRAPPHRVSACNSHLPRGVCMHRSSLHAFAGTYTAMLPSLMQLVVHTHSPQHLCRLSHRPFVPVLWLAQRTLTCKTHILRGGVMQCTCKTVTPLSWGVDGPLHILACYVHFAGLPCIKSETCGMPGSSQTSSARAVHRSAVSFAVSF